MSNIGLPIVIVGIVLLVGASVALEIGDEYGEKGCRTVPCVDGQGNPFLNGELCQRCEVEHGDGLSIIILFSASLVGIGAMVFAIESVKRMWEY